MEPLKYMINDQLIRSYSQAFQQVYKAFDPAKFENSILDESWENRELKDRTNHVTRMIGASLPSEFEESVEILERAAVHVKPGFEHMMFPTFVEFYGLDHFNRSMKSLEFLTPFSTAEFAIRPFIKKYPKETMQQMLSWSKHKNEHVRRLSSEGCRPRLPWGGNLKGFINEPKLVMELLENLKEDDSLYVRKSVANNLNDISKDHPERVADLSERWLQSGHKHTQWIVKKALRTLLKNTHPRALQLFGYGNVDAIEMQGFELGKRVISIGDRLEFAFKLKNQNSPGLKLRVEYVIEYKKKTGSSPKVFQVSEFELDGNSAKSFEKYQSFQNMTTRKHYPGLHKINIRVNGVTLGEQEFELR